MVCERLQYNQVKIKLSEYDRHLPKALSLCQKSNFAKHIPEISPVRLWRKDFGDVNAEKIIFTQSSFLWKPACQFKGRFSKLLNRCHSLRVVDRAKRGISFFILPTARREKKTRFLARLPKHVVCAAGRSLRLPSLYES